MKIYPTNNSWSYKVLEFLNKKIFSCGVPDRVCGYFWLSVFYGWISINIIVTVLTCLDFFVLFTWVRL